MIARRSVRGSWLLFLAGVILAACRGEVEEIQTHELRRIPGPNGRFEAVYDVWMHPTDPVERLFIVRSGDDPTGPPQLRAFGITTDVEIFWVDSVTVEFRHPPFVFVLDHKPLWRSAGEHDAETIEVRLVRTDP